MMRCLAASLLLLISMTSFSSERVFLTSLEWPPYSGEKLPQGGASVVIAKKAFEVMGYELVVDFYPWSRAVYSAKNPTSKYIGYLPEYYSESINKDFYFSDVIGSGPLGFVERKQNPVVWHKLEDLRSYTIGVVRDYVNTQAFDSAVAEGEQKVEAVTSDSQNILKVAGGRLPLAIVDHYVFDYLSTTDKSLSLFKHQLQVNSRLLEDKKLFVCFKRNKQGRELLRIFNQGLAQLDVDQMMKDYFQQIGLSRE